MKIILSICLFLLVGITVSCTSETKTVPPKKTQHIYAKYYVRYLQTEKELKAEVSFKEGDTLETARSIVLNQVNFEDNPMEVQNLGKNYGIRYGFRKKGPHRQTYQFSYSGEQMGEQVHEIGMSPITEFLIKEGAISKTSGMTLVWQGEALTKNQEMILLFTDEERKAFPVQIKGPSERTEVVLSAEQIAGLSLGKGRLMLVKKQFEQSRTAQATKVSEIEFYSNQLDIAVVE